jgi:hypothetical protein
MLDPFVSYKDEIKEIIGRLGIQEPAHGDGIEP